MQETGDAVTVVLVDPDGAPFAFVPGQFFTVHALDVTRNYSASNAPGTPELHLTIKRKEGGLVSGHMCALREGDVLRVLGPFGAFVAPPRASQALVLVAGGIGITPLASIARTLLLEESAHEIILVYGNRRAEDVVFAGALEQLERAHGSRFRIVHVREHADDGWMGERGRLDRTTTSRILDALPLSERADFFVCGPDPMRDEVLAALAQRGVAPQRIHVERFTIGALRGTRRGGPRPQAVAYAHESGPRHVEVRAFGRTHRTVALAGATLLEAGLASGAPMPFSCAVGGCGACRVRLVEGDVEMDEPHCLDTREREAGYVLACVGRPNGACVVELEGEGS